MFDADALAEALEKPAIKIGGEVFTGRLLSAQEVAPYQARFEQMADADGVPLGDVLDLLAEIYGKIGIPPEILDDQPPAVILGAIQDFFACQWRAAPNGGAPTSSS